MHTMHHVVIHWSLDNSEINKQLQLQKHAQNKPNSNTASYGLYVNISQHIQNETNQSLKSKNRIYLY